MTATASHQPFVSALDAGNFRTAGDWLVRSFASEVYGLCQAIVRDRAMAEDLSQEVFAKAFASLSAYRREASARTWLLAIARNRCIDHLRQRSRRSEFETDSDPAEFADEPALPHSLLSNRREIDQALEGLSEMERALIVLRFRNGLAYDELAQAFGLKTGTVRMRVSRALAKMRSSIEAPRALLKKSASKDAIAQQAPASLPSMAPQAPPRAGGAPSRSRRSAPPKPRAARAPAPPAQSSAFAPSAAPGAAPAPHVLSEYFADCSNGLPAALSAKLESMTTALSAGA